MSATKTRPMPNVEPVSLVGGGSAFCDACGGSLIHSWIVTYADGTVRYLCSDDTPEVSQ